ncbi:hypothetical protein [Rhizobacter sp. P5_C2]
MNSSKRTAEAGHESSFVNDRFRVADSLWQTCRMSGAERLLDFAGGCVGLLAGMRFIVSRRAAIGDDDDFWVYGWRAILIGCAALAMGALFFASAFGLVHIDHG